MAQNLLNFVAGAVNGGTDDGSAPGIGRIMSNGLQSAAEGYDTFITQQKQVQAAGKAADYFRKSLGDDAASQTGIPDEQWDTLGSRDKASAIAAFMQKQTVNELQSRMQEQQARADALKEGVEEKADEAGGLARWAQTMDQQVNPPTDALTGEPMTEDASVLNQFSPAQRASLHAVAGMGASNPRVAAPLLRSLFQQFGGGAGAARNAVPAMTTLGDNKVPVIYSPQTGKYEIDPAYTAKANAAAKPAATAAAPKTGKYPKGTKFPDGAFTATYPDGTVDYLGHPAAGGTHAATVAKQIADLAGGKTGEGGAPTALPLPMKSGRPDATKLQKGGLYQTARGAATWDGKQFVAATAAAE